MIADKAREAIKDAIVETVREVGEAPSGHIYAVMMSFGMDLETYLELIEELKAEKKLKVGAHQDLLVIA